MRIIPVLDIKDGVVVRGIAGRRDEYRPIVSRLASSARPIDLARSFRDNFGLSEIYVADLDAIAGAAPAQAIYQDLTRDSFRLWVDAGVRRNADAEFLGASDIARIVVGLETVAAPEELASVCAACGTDRVMFSLDLKHGQPLACGAAWGASDAFAIACRAIEAGVTAVIVLDLARVGVNDGPGTETLCRRLREKHPEIELVAGGGVRHAGDLQRLRDCGVNAVLVASALHDGKITAADVRAC